MNFMRLNSILVVLYSIVSCSANAMQEKPMVIIIPSYNNQRYIKNNLESVMNQEYTNYRVVYIQDCSSDKTPVLLQALIDEHQWGERITIINNPHRCGALHNLYHAIHACPDDHIIVTVDGDDWLAHNQVLQRLNEVYQDPNVWITYGQFKFWPSGQEGYCGNITQEMIEQGLTRRRCGMATHLRTFYAGLFKKIAHEDLLWQGKFYPVTWDKAMMAPMLEMAHGKWKFIPEVLYVYNFANPLNDGRNNGDLANSLEREIFCKRQYAPLDGELPF